MGILFAVLVGLFGHKAFNTKLYRGGYTLSQSFTGFGVVGGIIVLMVAGSYVWHVASGDESAKGGWTLAAIRGVAVPVGLYAFVTFVGIWRSAAGASLLVKLVSRYFSVFFLSTAGACVMVGWFNVAIAAVVYFLARRFKRPAVRDVVVN